MNHATAIRQTLNNVYHAFGEQVTIVEYDGREVLNVEECGLDAIEIGNRLTVPEGWFAEPINLGLLAIWPI